MSETEWTMISDETPPEDKAVWLLFEDESEKPGIYSDGVYYTNQHKTLAFEELPVAWKHGEFGPAFVPVKKIKLPKGLI